MAPETCPVSQIPSSIASPAPAAPPTPAARLRALGRPARLPLAVAGLAGAAGGWLLVPQAALIAWAIQRVLVQGHRLTAAVPLLAGLLAVMLARAGLAWLVRAQADRAVETLRHAQRLALLARLQAHGPVWLRRQRSGALAELPQAHVDTLEGYFGGFWLARTEIVTVPLVLILATAFADRVVAAILLVTLPLIPVFMALVGWGAQAASDRQLAALTRMGAHFADRLRGLGLLRLYGRAQAELDGIAAAADGVREGSLKVLRIAFLSSAVLEFFASMGVAMVALYLGLTYLGMLSIRSAPLDLGTGLFCLLLAPEVYMPLRRLAAHYHDRAAALAALDAVDQALGAPAAPAPAAGVPAAATPPGIAVAAHGLALRHAGAPAPALSGLSFALPQGAHWALAGPSGCGKSTLLEALCGWLPPDAGTLARADGLRIGYAPQRPHLFAGSLADNLRLGAPQASDAQVLEAARIAQVLPFAQALPQGLDTPVGERGFGLSGGQARRVALARALLRDPDLLLLDEPTAFLDPDTEAALLEALLDHVRGRTLLVASHSPAVLARLGTVMWLPQGTVSAAGARP